MHAAVRRQQHHRAQRGEPAGRQDRRRPHRIHARELGYGQEREAGSGSGAETPRLDDSSHGEQLPRAGSGRLRSADGRQDAMTRLIVACAATLALVGIAAAQSQGTQRPDPRTLKLRDDRFKALTYDEMTSAQKTMIDHLLSGPRASANGPFNVLLRSPEMGDLAQQFGASTRFTSSLPQRLYELAILVTARYWTSQYEWQAHHRSALQAGLSPAIADAIAEGRRPAVRQK